MSELKVYHHELRHNEYEEFYLKYEADKALAEKDKEIAELKSDIADLRDDKKSTDVILDERNAENAELKDKLQAANEQIENLINSASSIMLDQDKVNDNKCAELLHQKYKRCLDKANYCVAVSYQCVDDKHRQRAEKHNYKWLELAEKFKEAKL